MTAPVRGFGYKGHAGGFAPFSPSDAADPGSMSCRHSNAEGTKAAPVPWTDSEAAQIHPDTDR